MIAVGLIEIALGTVPVYFGVNIAATIWGMHPVMGSGMTTESLPEMMSSIQSAQKITEVALYIGGTMALFGIGASIVGAVRWLWDEPKVPIGVNTLIPAPPEIQP